MLQALFVLNLFSMILKNKSMTLETHTNEVRGHYYQHYFGFLVLEENVSFLGISSLWFSLKSMEVPFNPMKQL